MAKNIVKQKKFKAEKRFKETKASKCQLQVKG